MTVSMSSWPVESAGTEQAGPGLFLMTNTLETGGSERQFAIMADALRGRPWRVELGCMKRKGTCCPKSYAPPEEFLPEGTFLSWHAQRARGRLARHLREHGIAIAHAFDFYSNLMLIPVARWAGVRVVLGSQRQLGDLLSKPQFWVQKTIFHLCDRVICNSRAAAQRLREAGVNQHKLEVIPNAISSDCFVPAAPALPRKSGVLRVGMIGRMNIAEKNHAMLLRVAARLAPRFPHLQFILVGDGPLRPSLEHLAAQLGLGEQVQFFGERRDVPAILASLEVMAHLSSSESLSNAILEAMAAGLPVVALDVGGNPELIRHEQTGFLVPAHEEEAAVKALERLVANCELRRHFGERARELARSFELERIRDRYEHLYAELLEEKTGRSVGPHTAPLEYR